MNLIITLQYNLVRAKAFGPIGWLLYIHNSLYPYYEFIIITIVYYTHVLFHQATIFANWGLEWKYILLTPLIIGLRIEEFTWKTIMLNGSANL